MNLGVLPASYRDSNPIPSYNLIVGKERIELSSLAPKASIITIRPLPYLLNHRGEHWTRTKAKLMTNLLSRKSLLLVGLLSKFLIQTTTAIVVVSVICTWTMCVLTIIMAWTMPIILFNSSKYRVYYFIIWV